MALLHHNDKKISLFFWISVLYILYTIFPLFANLTGITPEYPALAVLIICVILYPKAFSNKVFTFTIIYLAILALYLLVGRSLSVGIGSIGNTRKFLIEAAWILPAVMIYSVCRYLNDSWLYKSIAIVSLTLLVVSFVYMIPVLRVNGYLLRENIVDTANESMVTGLPNYTLMHSYVFLMPALGYAYKVSTDRKNKVIWIGVIALFFYLIIHTYVTTSLFVTIIMLLSTILYKYNNSNSIIVFVIITLFVYLLYLLNVWSSIIDLALPLFKGTAVEYKLVDIQQSLTVGHIEGNSLVGRMDYHKVSIDAFWKNPIFGDDSAATHSSLLDRLGGFGLFGFCPFIMIFVSFLQDYRYNLQTNSSKFFWFCTVLAVAIFLYNKGLFGAEGWLFFLVIAPSFILFIQEKECNFTQDIEIP